jgi:hypothetical protein
MSFSGGHGAAMKLSKRKLDSLGYIKSFSGVHNDLDHLRRLNNKLGPAQSFASIADANESATHNATGKAEPQLLAPTSKNKLIVRGMDATKLTKKEIIPILSVYYGKQETHKKNKPILAELLKAEIELNEHVLHAI